MRALRALHAMSGAPSYPRFDRAATLLSSPARPAPHPLGCFRPPTEPAPSLPARPPRPPAPQGYTRSSHVTSAAYPRSGPDSYGSFTRESRPHEEHPLQPGGDRQAHAVQRAKLAAQAIRDPRYWTAEEVDAEAWKGKPGHWLAAERWARQHAGSGAADDGVTLVCCHANGCPKEVCLFLIANLLGLSSAERETGMGAYDAPAARQGYV